jgi:hypothetical protein
MGEKQAEFGIALHRWYSFTCKLLPLLPQEQHNLKTLCSHGHATA